MDEKQGRKRWTGEEIVAVIRRHLVDRLEISAVCEEAGCCPAQVMRWEKQFFAGGAKVFDRKRAETREVQQVRQRAEELERKLRRKDEVLAELMEEHVALKKTDGGPSGAGGSCRMSATRSSIS